MKQPVISIQSDAIVVFNQRPYGVYAVKQMVNEEKVCIDVTVFVQYLKCVPKSGI
jgi:hypothetical protein